MHETYLSEQGSQLEDGDADQPVDRQAANPAWTHDRDTRLTEWLVNGRSVTDV